MGRQSSIVPRASIRVSLNGDSSSALRNRLRDSAFIPNGFVNAPGGSGTATWTKLYCSEQQISKCMQDLWSTFDSYKQSGGKAEIDNFWATYENVNLGQLADEQDEWAALKAELDELGVGE